MFQKGFLTHLSTKQVLKFIALGILAILASVIAYRFNLLNYLRPSVLQSFIEPLGIFGPIVFIGLYALVVAVFLPASPLSVAGGALFGPWLGTFSIVIGATLGASIAFWIARLLGEGFVSSVLHGLKGSLQKIYTYDQELQHNGFKVVLFLRFIPVLPFNGLNLGFGLTKVSFKEYFLGTLLGIIPGTFALAYFGSSLSDLNAMHIILSLTLLLILMNSKKIWLFCSKRYHKYSSQRKENTKEET